MSQFVSMVRSVTLELPLQNLPSLFRDIKTIQGSDYRIPLIRYLTHYYLCFWSPDSGFEVLVMLRYPVIRIVMLEKCQHFFKVLRVTKWYRVTQI